MVVISVYTKSRKPIDVNLNDLCAASRCILVLFQRYGYEKSDSNIFPFRCYVKTKNILPKLRNKKLFKKALHVLHWMTFGSTIGDFGYRLTIHSLSLSNEKTLWLKYILFEHFFFKMASGNSRN